jgi:hypothetical protein
MQKGKYLNRADFLSRVSISIFGFSIALILQNLNGIGLLKLAEVNPSNIFADPTKATQLIETLAIVGLFSILFLSYWGCDRVNQWREERTKKWSPMYYLIAFVDLFMGTLPYWGYFIALLILRISG